MADKKIWEEKAYMQEGAQWPDMTPERLARGLFYQREYYQLMGEQRNRTSKWEELERLYRCERDEIPDMPNSFIPVINPSVNGQVASIIEKNVEVSIKGVGVADEHFKSTGQMVADFMLRQWNIKQLLKEVAKQYLLFGTSCIEMTWNPDAFIGATGANMGLAIPKCVPLSRIYIDGKIKNMADYQDAEWIIREVGFKSIAWVRRNYGDKVAESIVRLNHNYYFDGDVSYDDINATSVIYVWTRNNKHNNLQRIVMDRRGYIFEESDATTPYYDFVNNRYPFVWCGCYKTEEQFYRFGDGLLLKPLQKTINKLFDELVLACQYNSQPRTYIDPASQMDIDALDNDPSHVYACKSPHQNVYVAPPGQINPVVERLISVLMQEVEKATRYSALMSGNNPSQQMTATQAGIQVTQGNNTINDKRLDISTAIEYCIKYALGMHMELWPSAQAMRLTEDSDDFEWVDLRQLANVPVMVPATTEFKDRWQKAFPNSDISNAPKWMQLEVKNEDTGEMESATKSVDFDITVSLGEGLPNNKLAVYNILQSLAQLQLMDEATGQLKPLIGREKFKEIVKDMLGLNIEDDEQVQQMQQMATPMGVNANGGVQPTVKPIPNQIPGGGAIV